MTSAEDSREGGPDESLTCDEHVALIDHVGTLEHAAKLGSKSNMSEICALLGGALAAVKEHFRIGEESAWLETLREQQPRFGHTVEALLAEQCRLVETLDQLNSVAQEAAHLEAQVREDVCKWAHHIRQHESHEERLIQEACNTELGTAD
jgi:hypothetical protein